MSGEAIDDMYVAFSGDWTGLDAVVPAFERITGSMVSLAEEAGSEISASVEGIGENLASLGTAGGEAGAGLTEGLQVGYEGLANLGEVASETASEVSGSLDSVDFSGFQGALDSLTSSVQDAVSQIDEQLSSIPETAQSSGDETQSAFSGFSLGGMFNQVGQAIFNFQNMKNMAGQLASGLLGPAEQAENMQDSLTNLMGSSSKASAELSKLDSFAAKTQFTTADIDSYGAGLIGVGTKASNVIPELQAVGDNLSAVGKGTPAEMQSVVDIFEKIGSQGKITGGDLTELGTHGINALEDIARGAGLSTTEVQKMISNGTLPAKKGIEDLTKGIEENPIYKGGMAKQAGTLSGITSTLSSDWDHFMAKLVSPALPGIEAGLGKLTTLLTNPSFQAFATTLGTDIVGGFQDLVQGIQTVVGDGQALVGFFQHNQTAMDGLLAILGAVGVGVLAFAITQIPALVVGFGAWAIGAGIAAATTLAAAAPFILIGAVAGAIIFGIVEAVQHWGEIAHWLQGVWGGISGFFEGIWHGIEAIWGGIGKWFEDRFTDAKNKVFAVFSDVGKFLMTAWDNEVKGWEEIGQWFKDRFTEAWNNIVSVFQHIGKWLMDAWDDEVRGWQDIGEWFKDRFQEAWNEVTSILGHVGKWLMDRWDDEVQGWENIGSWFRDRFTEAWANITGVFGGIGEWFHEKWTDITDDFQSVFGGLKNLAANIFDGVTGDVTSAFNDVIGTINTVIDHIDGISVAGFHVSIPDIPYLAAGGDIAPGDVAVAGEAGPELVFGGTSGAHVLSHAASAGMFGSGEVHVHNHNHIYIDGQEMTNTIGQGIVSQWLNTSHVKAVHP